MTPTERPVLCAPASLKGVLTARAAAKQLAAGVRDAEGDAVELPVADGGEGTMDVLADVLGGRWRSASAHDPLGRPVEAAFLVLPDGTAVVEVATVVGLPLLAEAERDPLVATTEGLGELLLAVLELRPRRLLVCLGGSATVDGGRGMRTIVGNALAATTIDVACDVANPLLGPRGAARAFGPQKGASAHDVVELERRLRSDPVLRPFADLPGAGSAGGLGAAFAALGGTLTPGAGLVLETLRFDAHLREARLVVTGEGTVDETTFEGKAPGAVLAAADEAGVRAVIFGGLVRARPRGLDARALSGDPERASGDLVELGRELAAPAAGSLSPTRRAGR